MNQRVEKARAIYQHWVDGDGDMGELAVGLYDLTADYEALLADNAVLRKRVEGLILPKHKCEPIAVAQLNDVGGRAHWAGRLLEPVPGYEEETHCMHMKTPLKGEVVFGFIMADFHQLAALCEAANGTPINPTWVTAKAQEFISNLEMEGVRSALVIEEA